MNVHSDNRPFKCNDCSKTFRSRTAFKMHQDQHQGFKRFTCKFCSRQFQCHGNKLKHERRHIGDKKHKCHICDKGKLTGLFLSDCVSYSVLVLIDIFLTPIAFIEKQELKNHLKVHERRGLTVEQKSEVPQQPENTDNQSDVKTETN